MLMNASIKGLRDTSLKVLVHVTSDLSFEKNQSKPSCMVGWVGGCRVWTAKVSVSMLPGKQTTVGLLNFFFLTNSFSFFHSY